MNNYINLEILLCNKAILEMVCKIRNSLKRISKISGYNFDDFLIIFF